MIAWDNAVDNDGYTVAITDGVEAYRADTGLSLREAAEEFARTYDHNDEPGAVHCTATDLRTGEAHNFSFDSRGEVKW